MTNLELGLEIGQWVVIFALTAKLGWDDARWTVLMERLRK